MAEARSAEPDYILGKWLTTTSRSILNAPTGAGKTNFAVAMAAHMSAGVDFLHWKVARVIPRLIC